MTPKEKAKELIHKFGPFAKMVVDEIIKYSPNKPKKEYDPIEYFKKVKQEIQEIEKL